MHDRDMEQTSTVETDNPSSQELIRPVQGRIIAGVAQGLANRFDIPVGLLRVLFVFTALFGGLGVVLYAAGWGLIRSEDEPEAPVERFFADASTARSWIGIALIVWAVLIILGNVAFLREEFVWGVGLLVVGVLLYTGRIPFGSGERMRTETPADTSTSEEPTDATQGAAVTTKAPLVEPPSVEVPPPPPTPAPTPPRLPPRERSMLGRITVGLALLAMGVLALLDNLLVTVEATPRHYLALVVTVLGVGLLVGSVVGRARWLILIALLLLPPLLVSPLFSLDYVPETLNQNIRPTGFDQLGTSYSVEVGNLVIDLTELPWDGQTISLRATVDAGNLEIRVPEGVGMVGFASVDAGRITVFDQTVEGIGIPQFNISRSGDRGTVRLAASVDVGNIEITR